MIDSIEKVLVGNDWPDWEDLAGQWLTQTAPLSFPPGLAKLYPRTPKQCSDENKIMRIKYY